MRSIYVRVLSVSLLTAALSLAAFFGTARIVFGRTIGAMVRSTYALQVDQATAAFERGGTEGLKGFLVTLDDAFEGQHYLVNAEGRDVVTGMNRQPMLAAMRDGADRPVMFEGQVLYGRGSRNGQYFLLASNDPPFSLWSFAPFYAVVLASVVLVSWLLTLSLASPLRALALAAERFGRGDLAARAAPGGAREVRQLNAAFNQMAERIEVLLTSERRLLQDVSHELRSPLARLSFAAELARTAPDRDAAIDRVEKEVDRLGTLVNELIEITRAEGDPASQARVAIDVDVLVREIAEVCQTDADVNRNAVTVAVSGHAPGTVLGNRELLRRAIENVVRNAVQHAPAGSAVDVIVGDDNGRVTVSVRDYGPGVPADSLDRLFVPFFRTDDARQATTGGLGLGLAITYRAIHLHNGGVVAENARPGLRVIVTIPLNPATTA